MTAATVTRTPLTAAVAALVAAAPPLTQQQVAQLRAIIHGRAGQRT
jgi:hypothetical protein